MSQNSSFFDILAELTTEDTKHSKQKHPKGSELLTSPSIDQGN